jgi:hypothetical protein
VAVDGAVDMSATLVVHVAESTLVILVSIATHRLQQRTPGRNAVLRHVGPGPAARSLGDVARRGLGPDQLVDPLGVNARSSMAR